LVRFARDHGKPVYFWHVETTGIGRNSLGQQSTSEIADAVRGMTQFFVEGAPCMITKNTYMKHGVANGTTGEMHSLTWEEPDYTPELPAGWAPGHLVHVRQPYSFNVVLRAGRSGAVSTGVKANEDMIVPLIRKSRNFTVVRYNPKTRKRGIQLRCYSHDVAPTFAMTFHKSQGQTLPLVVLHLHKHPGRGLKSLQFQGLYVALSRVEQGCHIRVVFDEATGLKHIHNLRRPRNFDLWIDNYCRKTGKWICQGMAKMYQSQVDAAVRELQRIANLESVTKAKLVSLARVLDVEVTKSASGSLNKPEYINALYDKWVEHNRGCKKRGNKQARDPSAVSKMSSTPATPPRNRLRRRSADIRTPRKLQKKKDVMVGVDSAARKRLIFESLEDNTKSRKKCYSRPVPMCNPHRGVVFASVNCVCFINATLQLLASSEVCARYCNLVQTPVASMVSNMHSREGHESIINGMDKLLQSMRDYDSKTTFTLGSHNCAMEFMTWCLEEIGFRTNKKGVTRCITHEVCARCKSMRQVKNAGICEVAVTGDVIEDQEKRPYDVRMQLCWNKDVCAGAKLPSNLINFREIYIHSEVVIYRWGTEGRNVQLRRHMRLTTATTDSPICKRQIYELRAFTVFHDLNKHYSTYVYNGGTLFHCDDNRVDESDLDLSNRLKRCVMAIYERTSGLVFDDTESSINMCGVPQTNTEGNDGAQSNEDIVCDREWVKVYGDGFCWAYAFLVAIGALSASDFPNGDNASSPPSDNAISFSYYLARRAFVGSHWHAPQFAEGLLVGSGTYGGHSQFENILDYFPHTFRFFILDTTRTWIESAIVVKEYEESTSPRQTLSTPEKDTFKTYPLEVNILSFCTSRYTRSNTLLSYERISGPKIYKYLKKGVVPRPEDKFVLQRDTDVVICWATTNHFNALSPGVNQRALIEYIIQPDGHNPVRPGTTGSTNKKV